VRPRPLRIGLLIAAALALLALLAPTERSRPPSPAPVSVTDILSGGDTAGFAEALVPRRFVFPEDHGPHPAYRHEWWYFTGNLESPEGRRFGYQLTFFRFGLAADAPARTSRLAADQIYMAHFAVTDVAGRRFSAFERMSRAALGLAGAESMPLRIWVEDWTAEGPPGESLPLRLRAAQDGVAIDLVLSSDKPAVFHGERGLSRKGARPGNATYYYSFTRMPTRGTVHIGGAAHPVEGRSWLDREWGTSALSGDQVGWDWFGLQLDDGRELMVYRLRRRDGSADPRSTGTLVRADGSTRSLALEDIDIEVLENWSSPATGVRYPARFRLGVPSEGLSLETIPVLDAQELETSVRYWEGAVRVLGTDHGAPVGGRGYVELTGYGGGPGDSGDSP
jgi:predicted secreted hydrolase